MMFTGWQMIPLIVTTQFAVFLKVQEELYRPKESRRVSSV